MTVTSEEEEKGAGGTLGRSRLDKRFHGDVEGTSRGQMLTAVTDVKGSAGYVAIERVTGTLHGRRGTFVLQHTGTMTRGAPSLTVSVVPDPARQLPPAPCAAGSGRASGDQRATPGRGEHGATLQGRRPTIVRSIVR